MAIEGSRAYNCFIAIRLHFSSDYDFFKYSGKTKQISDEKLRIRKDYDHFRRLERKYEDLEHFIVANIIAKNSNWIGDLIHPRAEKNYIEWKYRIQNLPKIVSDNLKKCSSDLFSLKNATHPELYKKYLASEITTETMIVLENIFKYIEVWDKKIQDPILWPEHSRFFRKYEPFVHLSENDRKEIMANLKSQFGI